MESIKGVLMRRDKMSEEEAEDLISEARETLQSYLDEGDISSAEDICAEYFGLDQDYIEELF
jgi:hypothetical protein